MTVGHAGSQALATQRPSVAPSHVGGGPGLIDEHKPRRVKVELALEPGLAPLADVGPILLGGMRRLFLHVILWRRQKRQSALTLTWAPCSAKRAFSSGSVMSGTSAKAAWISSAWAVVRCQSRSPPCGLGRSPPCGLGRASPPARRIP